MGRVKSCELVEVESQSSAGSNFFSSYAGSAGKDVNASYIRLK
jgi:hypothetical protein